MDKNLLACLDPLMSHIGQTNGIKAVFSAKDFAELGKKRQPHDGAVYVVFDSLSPDETAQKANLLTLSVMVVLVLSQNQTSSERLGKQMSELIRQISSFRPHHTMTASPFVLKNSVNAKYIDGFIYLPMSFSTKVISI